MVKNIVLTGFMGVGKSAVGRLVAAELGREFVDMDSLIEQREGRPIPQIFAESGEPYFRRLEADLCRELASQQGLVIATGGGALVPELNLRVMEQSGLVICLDCEPEALWQRIGQSEDRPMLALRPDESRFVRLKALLEQRAPAYGRIKHHLDVTHLTPEEAAKRVCDLANEEMNILPNNMREIIENRLQEIERTEQVKVLYACESGSRAWGFVSTDSDYDVRFIYIRPVAWYLAIDEGRDVIEKPTDASLDINGWDLKKALKLFRKSNPPLFEWLNSPIVYAEKFSAAAQLRQLIPEYYSPISCLHHYLHMAKGNYRDYLQGEVVWVKKYFYVLRPLLACKWIERDLGLVPVEFEALLDQILPNGPIRKEIDQLLILRRQGEELDREAKIPILSDFIATELTRLESNIPNRHRNPGTEILDRLFRNILREVWHINF